MRSSTYMLTYAILQSVKNACLDKLETDAVVSMSRHLDRWPKGLDEIDCSVQTVLNDEENQISQLYHKANAEQKQLETEWSDE